MKFNYRKLAVGIFTSLMLTSAANAGDLLVYSSTDADNLKITWTIFKKTILISR